MAGPAYGNIALDSSWIGNLPARWEAGRNRAEIRQAFENLNPEDPDSLRKISWALAKAGDTQGAARMGELYRQQEQLRLDRDALGNFRQAWGGYGDISNQVDQPGPTAAPRAQPIGTNQAIQRQASVDAPAAFGSPSTPPPGERPRQMITPTPTGNPLGRPTGGVPSTDAIVGDDEAIRRGLYEDPRQTQEIRPAPEPSAPKTEGPVEVPIEVQPRPPVSLPAASPRAQAIQKRLDYLRDVVTPSAGRNPGFQRMVDQERDALQKELQNEEARQMEVYKGAVSERADTLKDNRAALKKRYEDTSTKNAQARTTLSVLNEMERISQNPSFVSGTGAESLMMLGSSVQALSKLAQNFGIPTPDFSTLAKMTGPMEAFDSLGKQLLRAGFTTLGSGVTNRDTRIQEVIFANLGDSGPGIAAKIEIQKKVAEKVQAAAREERRFLLSPGGQNASLAELDEHMAKWNKAHETFSEKDIARYEKIMEGVVEKQAKATPAQEGVKKWITENVPAALRMPLPAWMQAPSTEAAMPSRSTDSIRADMMSGSSPRRLPVRGERVGDYIFKGGDLNDRANWIPFTQE